VRTSTGVFLLVFIFVVAAFGWQALGVIALSIVGVFVLLMLLGAVAVWTIRRRMRRALQAVVANMRADGAAPGRRPATGPNVIDVEANDARDEGKSL
jgi:hypothetical protein